MISVRISSRSVHESVVISSMAASTLSVVKPSPPMQPCRNRKYAWGEVRVEGPPGTITVRASGLER